MEDWLSNAIENLDSYIKTFSGLSEERTRNFEIKRDHSVRVAENVLHLAHVLKLEEIDEKMAGLAAVYHDIGRYIQLVQSDSFNDTSSFDHADKSVEIIQEKNFLDSMNEEERDIILCAIRYHNKIELPGKLTVRQLLHARLLRDADKLDILKVLTDYYADRNKKPNHTLMWELPASNQISSGVVKEVMEEKLVSKGLVKSQIDIKIMQLSWVYDINFKSSVAMIFQNRYLEKIYESLPKNDTVIEIYRKVKVYAENRLYEKERAVQ